MTDDSDGFNRWDAGQKLALAELMRLYKEADKTGTMPAVDARFIEAMRTLWSQDSEDAALKAETFSMPGIKELEAALGKVSPRTLYDVRKHLSATLSTELRAEIKAVFTQNGTSEPYRFEYAETGRRALRNSAMAWLSLNSSLSLLHELEHEYLAADNMTDRLAAMSALKNHDSQSRTAVFDNFYDRYKDDKLTIQKWFMLQGASDFDGVIDTVKDIMESDVFNWENPGHAQSLMRGFISNYGQFHHADGRGYMFVADVVKKLDDINGTTASRFVEVLANWGNYSDDQAALMITALESIGEKADLTTQVREKLVKSLPKKDDGASEFTTPEPQ
jgi:aminopeptidase N